MGVSLPFYKCKKKKKQPGEISPENSLSYRCAAKLCHLQDNCLHSYKPLLGCLMHSGATQGQERQSCDAETIHRRAEDCPANGANGAVLQCEGSEGYSLTDFYFYKEDPVLVQIWLTT